LDRGFAHLAVGPIFIGDAVLAVGLVCAPAIGTRAFFRPPLVVPLLLFMALGAIRTAPYLELYGSDAVRDAVIWAYGLFALIVAAAMLRSGWLATCLDLYARILLPAFLLLEPPLMLLGRLYADQLPDVPGSKISILALKPGDAAVHYVGIAGILLLDLGARWRLRPAWKLFWWACWATGAFLVASESRGALVTIVAGLALLSLLWPVTVGRSVLLGVVAPAAVVLLVAMPFNPANDQVGRSLTGAQLLQNVESVIAPSPNLEDGTREWRIAWWNEILNYTLFGPYFWSGKGFGINLADADGFQVLQDDSLRSPHNSHLTILARMGLPGLAIWALLQGLFGSKLLCAVIRARRRGDDWWQRVDSWILAYWLAFLLNAAFDVYLEGPQGGIWFWSVVGFGMASLALQRERSAAAARNSRQPCDRPTRAPILNG